MEFDDNVKRIVEILNNGKDEQLLEKLVDTLIKSGVKIDFDSGYIRKNRCSSKFHKYDINWGRWGKLYVKIDFSKHDNEIKESLKMNELNNSIEERIEELEELFNKSEDQHQQDCIRYNDMRTAFLKAVDELAMLRKHFGAGQ